ncbi:MAG: sialate O-acetylesterase [Planctomycetota bacterium]
MMPCSIFRVAIWLLVALSIAQPTRGDIALPQMFTDNMVLQRQTKLNVFGTAEPKQRLTVQFRDATFNVTAAASGAWSVQVPTGEAGGPFELSVTAEEGQPQIKLSNVMVGEVWLCSGQSNMQWPVSKVLNSKTEIEQSINYPNIRFFSVNEKTSRQPLDQFEKVTGWDVCSPDSVGEFSGTAYFFARELSKKFPEMPIGLINASVARTACEAWISSEGLGNDDRFKSMLEQWDAVDAEDDRNRPSVLFNGMIAPIKPFPIRGVLWYQGERNNGRGQQYAQLLPTLIEDWRNYFEDPQLPFYFVQLAPYRYQQLPEDRLPEIWDAQLKTFNDMPNTGMVVTTDIGNIDDLNPKNKQEVGRRLSLLAIGNTYREMLPENEEVIFSGPIYEGLSTIGNRVRITFKHAKGLRIRGDDQALTCFTVCGEDQKFVPAVAKVEGESVVLSSPDVKKPVAVRFGWSDTAQPNLVNEAGLPASPFRTDNFTLPSDGKDF